MTRQEILDKIRARPDISVLIVGGGINGSGLLYDLALQGIDALLIDKGDFCGGASAASTRVIHGGLRYLENGEFRLVREALHERNLLLENAPHFVRPLPTTIPIFNWTHGLVHGAAQFLKLRDKPGDRGAILIKVGLTLYDIFAGSGKFMPTHQFRSRRTALSDRPSLNPAIICTATYYDAQIGYPERLCLELILDAETACSHAGAVNYMIPQGADGDSVKLCDTLSGESVVVRPRIVVNATGAWIDFTNRVLRRDTQYIGGTKGSHLVIDNRDLWEAARGEMLYFTNADGRICIFYRFFDKVLAGSTDIPIEDPELAVCDNDEAAYILESVRQVFPSIKIEPSDVVFRFCGVRPLPHSNALTPGQISRDHHCEVLPPGSGINFPIYSLVGGKWTTYRAFAEQVTDRILHALNRSRVSGSEHKAIGGGKGYPRTEPAMAQWIASMQAKTGLSAARIAVMLERYGTRAEEVAAFIAADVSQDAPLSTLPEFSRREILFITMNEHVAHLEDVIFRRTIIALLGQATRAVLEELAPIVGLALGWSTGQIEEEVQRTVHLLESKHGIKGLAP